LTFRLWQKICFQRENFSKPEKIKNIFPLGANFFPVLESFMVTTWLEKPPEWKKSA